MHVMEVLFSPCIDQQGWSMIIQKDMRFHKITCNVVEPLIGIEEFVGEKTLVEDMETHVGCTTLGCGDQGNSNLFSQTTTRL